MTAMVDDEVDDLRGAYVALQRRLGEALAELDEAEAQKAAMAEILEVINIGYLVPVFDAALEKATRLCRATYRQLATYDREFFRFVAVHVNRLRRDRSLNREQAQQRKICGHLLSVDNRGRFDDRW